VIAADELLLPTIEVKELIVVVKDAEFVVSDVENELEYACAFTANDAVPKKLPVNWEPEIIEPVSCPNVTLLVDVNAVPCPLVICWEAETVPLGVTPPIEGAQEADTAYEAVVAIEPLNERVIMAFVVGFATLAIIPLEETTVTDETVPLPPAPGAHEADIA
jgi:hypothetical protein